MALLPWTNIQKAEIKIHTSYALTLVSRYSSFVLVRPDLSYTLHILPELLPPLTLDVLNSFFRLNRFHTEGFAS